MDIMSQIKPNHPIDGWIAGCLEWGDGQMGYMVGDFFGGAENALFSHLSSSSSIDL